MYETDRHPQSAGTPAESCQTWHHFSLLSSSSWQQQRQQHRQQLTQHSPASSSSLTPMQLCFLGQSPALNYCQWGLLVLLK